MVGESVGLVVGLTVGDTVGLMVGLTVGEIVGLTVGLMVGEIVGLMVPLSPPEDALVGSHARTLNFRALDWADPGGYRQSPNGEDGNLFPASDNPPDGGRVEDPSEPWIDDNGHWHALFHAESASGQPWSRSGGHAFSQDGGASWTYTGTAYTTNVSFTDGSAVAFGRRERPHLVFADPARAGLPTHLSTGVQHGDGDATYTLVQPIAVH